jgi:hypothetical protein
MPQSKNQPLVKLCLLTKNLQLKRSNLPLHPNNPNNNLKLLPNNKSSSQWKLLCLLLNNDNKLQLSNSSLKENSHSNKRVKCQKVLSL